MNEPGRLEAVDQADFERMLHVALGAPDIREALHHPTAQVTAEQLRTRALTAADTIAAEAASEYTALLRLRVRPEAAPAPTGRPRQPATAGNGLLAALAALTPAPSAAAAAIFLLPGYGLQLTGTQQHLAVALIRAGRVAGGSARRRGSGHRTRDHRSPAPRHVPPPAAGCRRLAQAHAA
ncbi:hypothetical protein ACFYM3_26720 [Streptomyces massasporeus]|uniref:Uncharacterized protein n=1 Tax=Streptomyces massasporeus TaxID=67324 RepID=A0ABW6LKN9_9ACTN